MKAKYAAAIRYGIQEARNTRYGTVTDRYFAIRSQLIWAEVFPLGSRKEASLSLEAFKRERHRLVQKAMHMKTDREILAMEEAYNKAWIMHTETREERELRLLREEVEELRRELRDRS